MRLRRVISMIAFCLLCVLIATSAAQAQMQSLTKRNSPWEKQIVIVLPEDDDNEGDDEGDDEAGDCPPYTAPVRATLQMECWDQDGFPIACAGTGQDGDHQTGATVSPRFTDNLNGTTTDNLTGLIWLQDADCYGQRAWAAALHDANTLADGSCRLTDASVAGDWRLPNVNELQSLIEFGQYTPALPLGHPFSGVQSDYYWTSSSFENYPDAAWAVILHFGNVNVDNKANTRYVWPVRGGP